MDQNETKTTAQDASPTEVLRQAVSGFVQDFRGYQTEMTTKLQQTEERMKMLDRKMTLPARTPLGGATETHAPQRQGDECLYPQW